MKDYSKLISTAGFFPVRVEWKAEKSESMGDVCVEGLEVFFKATEALDSKVIFWAAENLQPEDFKYTAAFSDDLDVDDEYDETDEEQLYEVDLTVGYPPLAEFKKYLNTAHSFRLTAKGVRAELLYLESEKWWGEFLREKKVAISKVHDNLAAIRKKMEKEREAREAELEKLVKGLINDPEFVMVPTQRGMMTYAIEKYPELEEMDWEYLKILVQNLSDKIKTKRLNKRR